MPYTGRVKVLGRGFSHTGQGCNTRYPEHAGHVISDAKADAKPMRKEISALLTDIIVEFGEWGTERCSRWCDRQESNLYCELRKLVSYPLEDGRVHIFADRYCSCLDTIVYGIK